MYLRLFTLIVFFIIDCKWKIKYFLFLVIECENDTRMGVNIFLNKTPYLVIFTILLCYFIFVESFCLFVWNVFGDCNIMHNKFLMCDRFTDYFVVTNFIVRNKKKCKIDNFNVIFIYNK